MSHKHFEVTGQKVLLVGAGRGIGKGIALAFAEAGAGVAMVPISPGRLGLWSQHQTPLGIPKKVMFQIEPSRRRLQP